MSTVASSIETAVDWTHGLKCAARRHPQLMHWCGYVGIPKGHPDYGKDYDEIDAGDVHGGLTYASDHVPWERPDGNWWVGFDCAHFGDCVPGLIEHGTYRDLTFVIAECERLADWFVKGGAHAE